jgi:hypothetical protein
MGQEIKFKEYPHVRSERSLIPDNDPSQFKGPSVIAPTPENINAKLQEYRETEIKALNDDYERSKKYVEKLIKTNLPEDDIAILKKEAVSPNPYERLAHLQSQKNILYKLTDFPGKEPIMKYLNSDISNAEDFIKKGQPERSSNGSTFNVWNNLVSAAFVEANNKEMRKLGIPPFAIRPL